MPHLAIADPSLGPESDMLDPSAMDELRVPLADWVDPAAPDGPEGTAEANIVRSID